MARHLEQLGDFAKAMDGPLINVTYEANDPESVQAAIQAMEDAVDAKAAPYHGNSMVQGLANQTKANFRERLLQQAAEKRSEIDPPQ